MSSSKFKTPMEDIPFGEIESVDMTPYLPLLNYFGLPLEVLTEQAILHRPNTKSIGMTNKGHQPPLRPEPLSSGLILFHTNMKHPKLTTGAAMLLGRSATRQVLELDQEQADLYLHRLNFIVEAEQLERCHEDGYVLCRHAGFGMGLGTLTRQEEGRGLVVSLYPKAKMMHEQRSAFKIGKRSP